MYKCVAAYSMQVYPACRLLDRSSMLATRLRLNCADTFQVSNNLSR